MMEFIYCTRMQIACLLILLVLYHNLFKEGRHLCKLSVYFLLHNVALLAVLFDGLSVYTVNHITMIGKNINMFVHLAFFVFLNVFVFLMFIYLYGKTAGIPKNKKRIKAAVAVELIGLVLVACSMNRLEFKYGKYSDYSMGVPVYISFGLDILFFYGCFILLVVFSSHIEQRKKMGLLSCLGFGAVMSLMQVIFPELLATSLSVTIAMLGVYIHLENPSLKNLEKYHSEMVMGFATLVENRDDNTGGHIKRTSAYVNLILDEMKEKKVHKKELTKDFINSMVKAAPMHDIGKIGIPDSILQKPGKLTDEEFAKMKTHTVLGGEIIQDTFGHLEENSKYADMVYEVAMFHHEKWNGRGYPEGLSGVHIPLCARIMAVADVFDAISAKRCYRDAMPLDKCFEIIQSGSGTDFDPEVVEIFLNARPRVEEIYGRLK